LAYVLDLLREGGVREVVLCIGHLGHQIKDYFRNGELPDLNVCYSCEEGELLGTAGALKKAEPLLADWFFVVNGDTYLPIPYADVAEVFERARRKALAVVYDNSEDTRVRNNIALDEDLTVVRYEKDGDAKGLRYVEAGVSVLRREVLDVVEAETRCSIEEAIYPWLIEQRELLAYVSGDRFYDIGTPAQLKEFKKFLRGRRPR
jgi:NDP-sugar pyrophosphorylase family protein